MFRRISEKPIKKILEKEEERRFEREEDKVRFMEGLLMMYEEFGNEAENADYIEYGYRMWTGDGRLLYPGGGYKGAKKGICSNVPSPLTEAFVQDIVCTRGVLKIPDETEGMETFEERLLDYVIRLDRRGLIRGTPVRVDLRDPDGIRRANEELVYGRLTNGYNFLQTLEKAFRDVLVPKIEKNTGDYDPSHIRYAVSFAVGNGS